MTPLRPPNYNPSSVAAELPGIAQHALLRRMDEPASFKRIYTSLMTQSQREFNPSVDDRIHNDIATDYQLDERLVL
jgi:hypothetical protein